LSIPILLFFFFSLQNMSYKSTQTFVPIVGSEPLLFHAWDVGFLKQQLFDYYFEKLTSYLGFDPNDTQQIIWRGVCKHSCIRNQTVTEDPCNTWYVYEQDILDLGGKISADGASATIPFELACNSNHRCTRCIGNGWV